jgi:hypothetical protein
MTSCKIPWDTILVQLDLNSASCLTMKFMWRYEVHLDHRQKLVTEIATLTCIQTLKLVLLFSSQLFERSLYNVMTQSFGKPFIPWSTFDSTLETLPCSALHVSCRRSPSFPRTFRNFVRRFWNHVYKKLVKYRCIVHARIILSNLFITKVW